MAPVYIVLIVLGALLLLHLALYLFAIKPRFNKKAVKPYLEYKYAHRGYHGEGAEENSETAFKRAIEKGYGIEIDVRFSSDGELMVFHDETLKRVCGIDKRVVDLTCAELKEIKLGKTEEKWSNCGIFIIENEYLDLIEDGYDPDKDLAPYCAERCDLGVYEIKKN